MPIFLNTRPATLSPVLALVLLALLGCNRASGPRCYPVSGVVLLDGQPLAEAEVVFHSPADLERTFPKPTAQTDADGRFRLTTHEPHDGAPVGPYTITVELRDQRLVGEEMVRDGLNLLPPRYASPTESGLRFAVTAGNNEVPMIQIESQR